jgi:hypothetical protein
MESCKRKNSNRKKQKKTDKTKISSNQIKKKVKEKNDKNQLKWVCQIYESCHKTKINQQKKNKLKNSWSPTPNKSSIER